MVRIAEVNPGDRDRVAPLLKNNVAYVIYTSGSTGAPKGVAMPAQGLLNLLSWHASVLPGEQMQRVAQFTGVCFDVSVQEILSTLFAGKTLCIR